MINLTDAALREVRRLRQKSGDPRKFLRLGVANAGCSGMSYTMKLDSAAQPDDQVHEYGDLKVAIDAASLAYLDELTLDWSSDLMGGGFRFHNPKATHTCGCGSSFSTNPEAAAGAVH
ncbi:HesB/IscA family protein [Gloeobacter kilaueensis]|uniref:Iron-sulfur cluster assembly accessory protein n=1 Tax=Gloeobacter kilaueensis (strain ATCC BAA-2537 / CCAP 1431/1 / ULC 316 / JS1) TaxID=1183438 RepID=U5QGQ2_GLOK1|nr:iron-sulfur cluster assembly accessory protein [Gloeobacter kilaueensis]AGY58157.1 iron-sulfur cluster assembly accessory protein [Gloeobacter kilaueensis JS1]